MLKIQLCITGINKHMLTKACSKNFVKYYYILIEESLNLFQKKSYITNTLIQGHTLMTPDENWAVVTYYCT